MNCKLLVTNPHLQELGLEVGTTINLIEVEKENPLFGVTKGRIFKAPNGVIYGVDIFIYVFGYKPITEILEKLENV